MVAMVQSLTQSQNSYRWYGAALCLIVVFLARSIVKSRRDEDDPHHPKHADLSSKVSSVKEQKRYAPHLARAQERAPLKSSGQASSFVEMHEQVFLNFHNSSFTGTLELEESRPNFKAHSLTGKIIHAQKLRSAAVVADHPEVVDKIYPPRNFDFAADEVTDIFFDFDGTLTATTYRVFEYAAPQLAAWKGFPVEALFAEQEGEKWEPAMEGYHQNLAEFGKGVGVWADEFLPFVNRVLKRGFSAPPQLTDAVTYPGKWADFKPSGYKEPSLENLITYEEFDLLMMAAVNQGKLDHLGEQFQGERSIFGHPDTRKQLTDTLKALKGMDVNIHLLTANMIPRTQIALLERFCEEWQGIFTPASEEEGGNFWSRSGSTEMARVHRMTNLFDQKGGETQAVHPMEEWYDAWGKVYKTGAAGHPAMTEYADQAFTVEKRYSKCDFIKAFKGAGGVLVDDNFGKNIYDCIQKGDKYIQPDPEGVVQTAQLLEELCKARGGCASSSLLDELKSSEVSVEEHTSNDGLLQKNETNVDSEKASEIGTATTAVPMLTITEVTSSAITG